MTFAEARDGGDMKIGIGLPNALPGIDGPALLDWARRAEDRGFSTLATIDRLVYDSYDPLTVLAAAAAVTTRITLATTVLLAPLHTNHVGLAKQAASLDRLAGGRLLLGLAPGPREDDFAAAGVSFRRRGADLDRLLDRVTAIWRDPKAEIGPKPATPGGPPLLFGRFSPPAFRRVASHGTGWVSGVFGVAPFRAGAARAIDAWNAAGRDGSPPATGLRQLRARPDRSGRRRHPPAPLLPLPRPPSRPGRRRSAHHTRPPQRGDPRLRAGRLPRTDPVSLQPGPQPDRPALPGPVSGAKQQPLRRRTT
jgi:alkanesulfonate monooxygenase SsuD/methylene tetrahydromethanopterin reductase-like flavin-dependent oxidoreductase (luciferase family)